MLKQNILELKNISIEFPGVRALDNVDFFTKSGVVHALVGANGAGKSTLMKVLAGAYNHYTGEIYINDQLVNIRSPRDAKRYGIQIVYQEVDTALVPYLTVAENIMLDILVNDMNNRQTIDWKKVYRDAEEILDNLNLKIHPKKLVQDLTLAQKQMVLIARAISKDCKFLILDEPTAPLSNSETEELFRVIKNLTKKNVGIIFISHRLPEIFGICDEITVMRDGKFIVKKNVNETNQNEIVEYMLGRKFTDYFPKHDAKISEVLFDVKELNDGNKLKDINLHVKSGEIVGIAGLVGAGKTELCKALYGESQSIKGQITIKNQKVNIKSPYYAVKHGIALIPEERRKEGILVNESVASNISITCLNKICKLKTVLDFKKEREIARKMISNLRIKTPSEQQKVGLLSGGNQQKVVVAKWLNSEADIYIFDEPTKGVDVGAKKDIFDLIGKLAQEGKGIIYATCEFSELLNITDRIYVMYNGKIVKELITSKTTEEELLFYSTGGK